MQAVAGPIHVTNCNDTTIISVSRQLRVHECKNVTFSINVSSGPIIEDCKNIVFTAISYDQSEKNKTNKNMYWDVKDFNWLKTSVPSPNFKVLELEESDLTNEKSRVITSSNILSNKNASNTDKHLVKVKTGDNKVGDIEKKYQESRNHDVITESDDDSDEDEL